jgi:RimJ/RimL family protein N-acetyltransferase
MWADPGCAAAFAAVLGHAVRVKSGPLRVNVERGDGNAEWQSVRQCHPVAGSVPRALSSISYGGCEPTGTCEGDRSDLDLTTGGYSWAMEMPQLETERLVIRALREDDLAVVLALLDASGADAEAATKRYVQHGGLNAQVLSELRQPPIGDRAVLLRGTDTLIGLAGLVPAVGPFDQLRAIDEQPPQPRALALHRIEIGLYYHVDVDLRGRGYASEAAQALVDFAFEGLRLARIVATTERENLPSQAVMRHLGMRTYENSLADPAWFQIVGILENPGRAPTG